MGEQESQEQKSKCLFSTLFILEELLHWRGQRPLGDRLQWDCNPLLAYDLTKEWFTDTLTGDKFIRQTYWTKYEILMELWTVRTKGIEYKVDFVPNLGGIHGDHISFHINGEETEKFIFEQCLENQQTPEEYMSS